MQRTRGRAPGLVGLLLGGVVLAGCSHAAPDQPASPAPASVPASTAPTTAGPSPSTATPAPTTTAKGTPAPKPSSGGGTVVPRKPVTTAPPKKLDEPARTAGAKVALDSVKATTIKASGPGDRSGPGVLVSVSMTNGTSKKIDTSYVQVGVTNGTGRPGTLVDGSPTHPVGGSLRSGSSVQGTYAFLLDDATSAPVTVSVSVAAGQPVLQFRGRAR